MKTGIIIMCVTSLTNAVQVYDQRFTSDMPTILYLIWWVPFIRVEPS